MQSHASHAHRFAARGHTKSIEAIPHTNVRRDRSDRFSGSIAKANRYEVCTICAELHFDLLLDAIVSENVLSGSIYFRRKSQSINQAENSGDALCRVHTQYVPTYIQICLTEEHTINSVEMKLHIKNLVWAPVGGMSPSTL